MELLEAHASAPGKVILFGEHAVVYGEPSLSLALDRRTRASGETVGSEFTVNGFPLNPEFHAYIERAIRLHWKGEPLRLQTESAIPSGSGIGSSAALSVVINAVLLRLSTQAVPPLADVARAAFETEFATQGAASPNDTTVATAGGGVLLSPRRLDRPDASFLWSLERGGREWHAHRVQVPKLPLVVGNSGTKGRTSEQVAKVKRFVEKSSFARDTVRDIGRLTFQGVEALRRGDLRTLGDLMNRNHALLHTLGVDTPRLAQLVEAARKTPGTLGAKLTGAGGGGCMIALTEDPAECRRRLEQVGASAFAVEVSPDGLRWEPER